MIETTLAVILFAVSHDAPPPRMVTSDGPAVQETAEPMRVEAALREIMKTRNVPADLVIEYNDLDGFHGGLRMCVDGLGGVEQEVVLETEIPARRLAPEEILLVVESLVEFEAWKQIDPVREALACESSRRLTITLGDARTRIWELYTDSARIRCVGDLLKSFAWYEPGEGRQHYQRLFGTATKQIRFLRNMSGDAPRGLAIVSDSLAQMSRYLRTGEKAVECSEGSLYVVAITDEELVLSAVSAGDIRHEDFELRIPARPPGRNGIRYSGRRSRDHVKEEIQMRSR